MNAFAPALGIANAVLYEGFLLFPYTASTRKNQVRWQFGVAMPLAYRSEHPDECSELEAGILLETEPETTVEALLRFLHVESRTVEEAGAGAFRPVETLRVGESTYLGFDGAVEREVSARLGCGADTTTVSFAFEAARTVEDVRDAAAAVRGRVVRDVRMVTGRLFLGFAPADDGRVSRLTVRVENGSALEGDGSRDAALRTALISTHVLLRVESGRFLSSIDPPAYAREAAAALEPRRLWPVLIGEARGDVHGAGLALITPIILDDFPAVAPQSDGDWFDATEVDELLNLSVLSLSDAERAEARATDPRARAIVERAERFGREQLERLHGGVLTHLGARAFPGSDIFDGSDPFASIDVPSIDCVFVDGVKVSKGSSVRLNPKRRADVWDMILTGRTATVSAIHQDLEDQLYVAVTVDDDPATPMHEWYGRSLFFSPDEVEPIARPS